jgi:hypothetical protein
MRWPVSGGTASTAPVAWRKTRHDHHRQRCVDMQQNCRAGGTAPLFFFFSLSLSYSFPFSSLPCPPPSRVYPKKKKTFIKYLSTILWSDKYYITSQNSLVFPRMLKGIITWFTSPRCCWMLRVSYNLLDYSFAGWCSSSGMIIVPKSLM